MYTCRYTYIYVYMLPKESLKILVLNPKRNGGKVNILMHA
jgi:hypothetical protein